MKGKGKKGRDSEDECPLMYLDFKSLDYNDCPRLAAVLSRPSSEGVGLEDLDTLQLELESLLVSVIARKEQVENETESLAIWQDAKSKEKKSTPKDVSCKRSKVEHDRVNKKFRDSPNTSSCSSSASKSQPSKHKQKSTKVQDYEYATEPLVIESLPPIRNDLPERFWNFIEPYCGEIKPEDLKFLEDTLSNCELDSEYLKVPNLGKHYSLKWMQEESNDKSSTVHRDDKKKGLSPYNSVSEEKPSKKSRTDKSTFGMLTQRLVSCLIEENFSINGDGFDFDLDLGGSGKNSHSSNYLFKSINFGNTTGLEKRIRKELEAQGLLDPDLMFGSDVSPPDDDEVLKELIQCQNDLKTLTASNQSKLRELIEESKNSIEKQAWMQKLEVADAEVIECYKKILAAKQKKRTFSKKDKELAIKALKDREAITKKIDSLER